MPNLPPDAPWWAAVVLTLAGGLAGWLQGRRNGGGR